MNRYRIPLLILAASCVMALPLLASAQVGDLPSSIIPKSIQKCPASWGGLIEGLNNLIKFALSFAIIIGVLMVAYAGFLLVLSPANPENRGKARGIITNAGIGLIIALAAWLIVNTILIALTDNKNIGTWTGFISSSGDKCIESVGGVGPGEGDSGIKVEDGVADGRLGYDTGIEQQAGHASPQLSTFLSCMANKLPAKVGRVSSISDSTIVSGDHTFQACAEKGKSIGCAHKAGSCHYGGSGSCTGKSYAVDFGDQENEAALRTAANACGADYILDEGTHIHVSVGKSCGCN